MDPSERESPSFPRCVRIDVSDPSTLAGRAHCLQRTQVADALARRRHKRKWGGEGKAVGDSSASPQPVMWHIPSGQGAWITLFLHEAAFVWRPLLLHEGAEHPEGVDGRGGHFLFPEALSKEDVNELGRDHVCENLSIALRAVLHPFLRDEKAPWRMNAEHGEEMV